MSGDEVLVEIRDLLTQSDRNDRLWTLDDIAWFTQLTKATIKRNYVNRKDFPKPVGGLDSPRFNPDDVRKWASARAGTRQLSRRA